MGVPVFNAAFLESGCDIIWLANQADANTDVTGDWIKLRDYTRVGILLSKLGTEDVDDLGLQFLQATTNAGTSKALVLPANRPVWYKTGTLTSQTVWTRATSTTDTDGIAFGSSVPTGFTRFAADVNTSALLLYTELLASDLDVDGGYSWMTCFVEGDNVDNACLLSVQALLLGGRFPQAVPLSCIS
jgi:hypothetical protein